MNPFPVQHDQGLWYVIHGNGKIPCSSKEHADLLAQIPIQRARIFEDAPNKPDLRVVEKIVKIGSSYGLITMRAYRDLENWLSKQSDNDFP